MNGVTAQTWKALQCLKLLLTFKQAECRFIWDSLTVFGSPFEGLQGKPGVFIAHTQEEKFNSCSLLSPVVCKQKLELYKSPKKLLEWLSPHLGCLESLLWVWTQFSAAVGNLLFSLRWPCIPRYFSKHLGGLSPPERKTLSAEQWHTRYKEHVLARKMTQALWTQACCVPLLTALCSVFSLSSLSLASEICNHGFKNLLQQFLASYTWQNEKSCLLGRAYLVLSSMPTWEDKTNPFDCTLWLQQWLPLRCQQNTWLWPLFPHWSSFLSAS